MNNHTPGPWTINPFIGRLARNAVYQCVETKAEGIPICQVVGSRAEMDDESIANARLIAAAPELLNAAKIGLACCVAWGGKCEAAGELILARASVIQAEIISAAIAKAEAKA